MIWYAPALIRPRRVETPSSHIDILPTLASFCDRPYMNQTLGLDLLDPAAASRSVGFILTTFRDPPDLEVIDGSGPHITRHESSTLTLGSALYEASRWLLYHNR